MTNSIKNIVLLHLLLVLNVCNLKAQENKVQQYITSFQADDEMFRSKYRLSYNGENQWRLIHLAEEYLNKLMKIDFKLLSLDEQIDYILFKNELNNYKQYKQLNLDQLLFIKKTIPFSEEMNQFSHKRSQGIYIDSASMSQYLDAMQAGSDTILYKIGKNNAWTLIQLNTLNNVFEEYQDELKYNFKFYDGYDTIITNCCKEKYKKVVKSFRIISDTFAFLKKSPLYAMDSSGINGVPVGRQEFMRLLKSQFIEYTPEELLQIATEEMAWCDHEMMKVSAEMGFGSDWRSAIEKIKNDYMPMGHQPELVRFLADEVVKFIEKKDLITIPEKAIDGWSMEMLSPESQKYAPYFLGGKNVYIAYPHMDMTPEERLMVMRGNNKHFTRAVVFHELIPGHNLQYYMTNRYKSYRAFFHTPFWTEGWSLYWEMLLYDKNFATSPEDKLGMLFWRRHRCARIIFSTKYHLHEWTPQQCIDYLVQEVGHEKSGAKAEVNRSFAGGYGPLYQLAYMIGGLQFKALHREMVINGTMSDKNFHDTIMHSGSMPIAVLRKLLQGKKLISPDIGTWGFRNALN